MGTGRKIATVLLVLALVAAIACMLHEPRHGLHRAVYAGKDFKGKPVSVAIDRVINFGNQPQTNPDWLHNNVSARWTGYLNVPRNGDYLLRVTSDDGTQLFVDATLVVDNAGDHRATGVEKTVPLTEGAHPVRLDYTQGGGGAALKLEWQLPAGYNSLSMLPISQFVPDKPQPLTWRDWALRQVPLWLLVTALLAWQSAALARFFRRLRAEQELRRLVLAGAFVTLLGLVVRLWDLNGAGETCDEWAYTGAGRIYADNIAAGIFDSEQWQANREHPAVGKLLYGLWQFLFGADMATFRTLAAILNSLTILLTFWAGWRLGNMRIALGAGLLLALLPPFIAHGKVAGLDATAAFFFTLSLCLLLEGLRAPAQSHRLLLWLAVVVGLAVGTKLTNVVVFAFVLLAWPLYTWRQIRESGEVRAPAGIGFLPISAPAVVLLTWPWLWSKPVAHLSTTLGHWGEPPAQLFLGGIEEKLPVSYFLVYFYAVTPVVAGLAFLAGVLTLVRRRALVPRWQAWFLPAWLLLPFVWSVAGFRQDGVRYVYAAFPPFALVCGFGLDGAAQFLGRSLQRARLPQLQPPLTFLLLLGMALNLAAADLRIHPYYLDYFSESVGGPGQVYARRLFETGWWGEGNDRAEAWLNAHARKGSSWGFRGLVNHTFIHLRKDLHKVDDKPDYWVRGDLAPGDEAIEGYTRVWMQRADGAPIVAVYQRKP
jgi:4-amino-4-deoxy-L-arabinose transferase-like glycosyltransferase